MEEQIRNAAVAQLVALTGVGNASAWQEKIFMAQSEYPGLSQAGIALEWVKLAKANRLVAVMDRFVGLQVAFS